MPVSLQKNLSRIASLNTMNKHLNTCEKVLNILKVDQYIFLDNLPKPARIKGLSLTSLLETEELFDFIVDYRSITKTKGGNRRVLLSSSAKVIKGEGKGYKTKVLYVMASDRSGFNMCPWAGSCRKSCLEWTTGRMKLNAAQKAHYLKALWFKCYPLNFLRTLVYEIISFGVELMIDPAFSGCVRLDGTSDIGFFQYLDIDALYRDTGVVFYDYTKRPIPSKKLPKSYHTTFSIDEQKRSMNNAQRYLDAGYSAALVVAGKDNTLKSAKAAQRYILDMGYFLINDKAYPAIDGDKDDLRFLDPAGSVVILHAKGRQALTDTSGFVYRVPIVR